MTMTKAHVHIFDKERQKKVTLHNYVWEKGKIVKDLITGVDVLSQRVCGCGAVQTYSIARTVK